MSTSTTTRSLRATITTTVAVVGGGQAGLAMSSCLSRHGINHVVLERGRVGERWRSERWDSLRLLTPNWMTRLPGYSSVRVTFEIDADASDEEIEAIVAQSQKRSAVYDILTGNVPVEIAVAAK